MMTIDASLEIRKLPPSHIAQLSLILEYTDQWKKLMSIVPKSLLKDNFECTVSCENPAKYNSDHIRLIETAAHKYKRTATEILLDEWGCSGRIRPTIGHLLFLLVQAELFRAADYVAEKILHKCPPKRPNQGPAASVSIDINKHIEGKLDEMDYSSNLIEQVAYSTFDNNKNHTIPQIIITPDEEIEAIKFKVDEFILTSNEDNESREASSMMKFSTEVQSLISDDEVISERTESNSVNFPDSNLRSGSVLENLPLVSMLMGQSSSGNIPNLSELMDSEIKDSSPNSIVIPSTRQFCASPLPNLTLNTNLPHFKYHELEIATNHFDEKPYEGDERHGRFLGAGAFGKVFLATNISDKPVAVKKLLLENTEVVTIDDTITKQFKNEVEVLSKFRHENLLLLLGYSCDGSTYCLLYEYISGGTLKDRLKCNINKLTWQERLLIAFCTSKAISYLHTAFSSPLIHRDIKTANILLDSSNKPKLGDFGITKLLNNPNNTNTCTVMGTSAYMAPEALRGDISVKCDTFSFGVVLLELLTSLLVYDEKRDGNDLVTYVEEQCEDSIQLLLDKSIGDWIRNDIDFGDELYKIAVKCLDEKRKRPIMVDVKNMLEILSNKM